MDPETFSRSRMSYYTGIAFAAFTDETVMPLKDGTAREVTGIPEGYWVCDMPAVWGLPAMHALLALLAVLQSHRHPRGLLGELGVAGCNAVRALSAMHALPAVHAP